MKKSNNFKFFETLSHSCIREKTPRNSACRKFGISPRTMYRTKPNRATYITMDSNKVSVDARDTFKAKHIALESQSVGFIQFGRNQRLPVL